MHLKRGRQSQNTQFCGLCEFISMTLVDSFHLGTLVFSPTPLEVGTISLAPCNIGSGDSAPAKRPHFSALSRRNIEE